MMKISDGEKSLWYIFCYSVSLWVTSVLWRCWVGGRKGIRPVNTEWWGTSMVICLERGANDLYMVQLMPLPSHHLLLQYIQNGLPFWRRLTRLSRKMPLNECSNSRPSSSVAAWTSWAWCWCIFQRTQRIPVLDSSAAEIHARVDLKFAITGDGELCVMIRSTTWTRELPATALASGLLHCLCLLTMLLCDHFTFISVELINVMAQNLLKVTGPVDFVRITSTSLGRFRR